MPKQYEPKEHIRSIEMGLPPESVLDQRELTVQAYRTSIPFIASEVRSALDKAWLTPAVRLGVFQASSASESKDEIRVVLGLQGIQDVRAYDYDHRRPLYFSWMGAIVETMAVSYSRDEYGMLQFTTFGGGSRITEERIGEFHESLLNIPSREVVRRLFDLSRLRDLCFKRFPDRLYMIRFSNSSRREYMSIEHASFRSRRYIDPAAERFQEVKSDPDVQIESFDSDVAVTDLLLSEPAEVRFAIQGLSGALRMRFPKLSYRTPSVTQEQQATVFYGVADTAVRTILDADYYARQLVKLADLSKNPQFPEFADTSEYRELLKIPQAREEFFDSFDGGAAKQLWLPHLRALDELLAGEVLGSEMQDRVRVMLKKNPNAALKLLRVASADARMSRIAESTASTIADQLQMLPADSRHVATQNVIAWALLHDATSWGVDPTSNTFFVRGLVITLDDLSLSTIGAVLWKLVTVLHKRMRTSACDVRALLCEFQWCIERAKQLSANDPEVHAALRLVAANRSPCSPKSGNAILKKPVSDLSSLDSAVLEQYGLPLWPYLHAHKEGKELVVTNDGIGVANKLSVKIAGSVEEPTEPVDLLPSMSVRILTGEGASTVEATFEKLGASRIVMLTIENAGVVSAQTIRASTGAISRKLRETQRGHQKAIDPLGKIVGSSPAILGVFEGVFHANLARQAILLCGEPGVGKTYFAKLVHESSGRSNALFKAVNAGGAGGDINIQRGEWLGYGKNHGIAGVDKNGRPGHVLQMTGGTLFVDEFSSLSLDLQVVFLSVLECKPVEKVGGESFTPDVRCVFATNANIEEAVAAGKLRRDLLDRIPVRVTIPPLRERCGDILPLARAFAGGGQLDDPVLLALMYYGWPGNVRELQQTLSLAYARRTGDKAARIGIKHLGLPSTVTSQVERLDDDGIRRELWTLADRIAKEERFEAGAGLQRRAAEIIGVNEPQASKMYDQFGLSRAS